MRIPFLPDLIFILLLALPSSAQEIKIRPEQYHTRVENAAKKSELQSAVLFKSIDHAIPGDKWAVSVKARSSRTHALPEVAAIKAAKKVHKVASSTSGPDTDGDDRAITPVVRTGFEANWSVESSPPDNTIAISNEGIIVSANNDGIEYYSDNGTFLYFDFWSDFFNDNSLTSSLFDPKVIYDSEEDRFVLIVLHGSMPTTSRVLVCFSKTKNPMNGWWVYKLTGNPGGDNSWFDFPALGVSNNEVYVSGNLFSGNSFNQAVVYQINKADGYAGAILDWQYWSDFFNDPFAITPASYGQQGNYGPGIYLISSAAGDDDNYWLWDLTDDIGGSPEFTGYVIPADDYSPAADALQSGTSDELDVGDCRVLSAFYLDGIIHFVHHTDIGGGWNGISYNRLSIPNQSVLTSTFGQQGESDCAYPSVASFATGTSDRSVMISFLRTSASMFPQCRIVNCDQAMTWSNSTLVKAGETFVDFLSSDERWGDYTGIARRHNEQDPRVWMSGAYGANIPSQGVSNTYKTWIAEVTGNNVVSTQNLTTAIDARVFPNPVYEMMYLVFTMEQREEITIAIHDTEGHLVKSLYRDSPRTGEHKLTFNKGALAPGMYILTIASPTQTLKYEKIIIAE